MTEKRKLRVLSASQYERWQCPRRGWLEYVQGHKQPTSESLLLGSEVHRVAEHYLKTGTLYGSQYDSALQIFEPAIPLIPKPGTVGLQVEQAISFETPHSAWRGAIDYRYRDKYDDHVIGDFKTTKHVKYKKTEYELKKNVQANLYAYWASQLNTTDLIRGEWIYLSTGPERGASVTHVDFDRAQVEDFVGKIDERAALIQDWYEIPATESSDNLGVDSTKCYEYGKPCHHRVEGRCTINQSVGFERSTNMGNSILDRIAKERAKKLELDIPKASEEDVALVKEVAPQLAEFVDRPIGEPESGFINPPEGAQTSRTANDTIVSQGLASLKAEDMERAGEVDERAQLKAECVRLGLCEPNSRLRVDALRKLLMDHGRSVARAEIDEMKKAEAELSETVAAQMADGVVRDGVSAWNPVEPIPGMRRKPKPIIILYVDCLPNTAVVDAHTMVGNLLPDVLKQVGEQHVKFVQYGKGSAALAVALEKHLEGKVLDQVFVDSRTAENDVLAVLVRSADVVVRGLR